MQDPIPDGALLRELLALIEAEPDRFDAGRFASKDPEGVVRFDLGGFAVAHRYPRALWRWKPDFQRPGWQLATAVDPRESKRPASHSVYYLAMKLLNVGFDTAKQLFATDITIPELCILIHQLATISPEEGDRARS